MSEKEDIIDESQRNPNNCHQGNEPFPGINDLTFDYDCNITLMEYLDNSDNMEHFGLTGLIAVNDFENYAGRNIAKGTTIKRI